MCQWPEERITKILSKKHIKGTIVEKVVMYKIDRRGEGGERDPKDGPKHLVR